ncbi:hypothetical protein BV20DRAFT_959453, partial [Pilatotrama ljubarskyi]
MGATGINRTRRPSHPARTRNRTNHTPAIQYVNGAAITHLDLGLRASGIRIRPATHLTGVDITDSDDDAEEETIGPDTDIDTLVNLIWAQFAYDLIQVSPNLKGRYDPPYTTLTQQEQTQVTADMYKKAALPFRAVWFRARDLKFWDLQFGRFFPSYDIVVGKIQNYTSCRYFQQWMRVRAQTSKEDFEFIRSQLRKLFRGLVWLPSTDVDRIWDT